MEVFTGCWLVGTMWWHQFALAILAPFRCFLAFLIRHTPCTSHLTIFAPYTRYTSPTLHTTCTTCTSHLLHCSHLTSLISCTLTSHTLYLLHLIYLAPFTFCALCSSHNLHPFYLIPLTTHIHHTSHTLCLFHLTPFTYHILCISVSFTLIPHAIICLLKENWLPLNPFQILTSIQSLYCKIAYLSWKYQKPPLHHFPKSAAPSRSVK